MSQRRLVLVAVVALAVVAAVWLRTRAEHPSQAATGPDAGTETGSDPATGSATATPTATPTGTATATPTGTATARRGDGAPSSELPRTPPARYHVTDGGGRVFVDLRGGASTMTTMRTLGEPDAPTRRLRGRVVDASGAPVTDAVVLAGHGVDLRWANLSADAGAAVDASGAFDLAVPLTEVTAIALSRRGWSESAFVAPGTTAAPLTLRIDAPARIRGVVTRAGAAEQAALQFRLIGSDVAPRLNLETDAAGRFDTQPFPPGHYHLQTGQSQLMGGGNSAMVEQRVDVVAGQTTELAIELPAGNLLVVDVPVPDGSDGTVAVTVIPGHVTVTVAEAKAAVSAGAADWHMAGGSSLGVPMEFHDRAPGDYTACAEVELHDPPQTGFRCQPVTLTAAVPIFELTIEVPLSQAPPEPQ